MVKKNKKVTLVSPHGREYVSEDRAEVTRLKSRGYKTKPATPKPAAPSPAPKK